MRAIAIASLFVAAACGDDGVRHLGDAPVVDPDASIDAATSGPVSLLLMMDGAPRAGIDVFFQDASSGLVATVATGADGIARATMEPGGFVTVVDPFFRTKAFGGQASGDVRTFAGVKPGDQLRIDGGFVPKTGISVNITLPVDTNANMYDLYTSCSGKYTVSGSGGSGSDPSTGIYMEDCGGFVDVLVQTTDFNAMPLGWFYHPNVAVSDGANIVLTDTYNLESAMPSNVTMTFSNVPAPYTGLAFTNVTGSMRGPILELLYATNVTAGAGTQVVSRPPVTNAFSVTATHPTPTNNIGSQFVIDWGLASTVAFDLSGALLPLYSTVPEYTAANHSIAWTAGTGAAPDLVITKVYAQRDTMSWRWRVVAPYAQAVVLPVLPTALAAYNILATDSATVDELTTAKVPGGYDAVRARLHSLLYPEDLEDLAAGTTTPTGRIVYERLENQVQF